jgi:hypothetical protein
MSDTNTKINFRTVVINAIGSIRECNDGSGCESFILSSNDVDGLTDNLTTWWNENYADDSTLENAEEYFDKIYPEF